MRLFDGLINLLKADQTNLSGNHRTNEPMLKEIKNEDLHITDGLTRKLNIEKLEWCLTNGIDNEAVRAAIKEKERNDKIQNADMEFKAQRKILFQELRVELSKYTISRKDDTATKLAKKSQKDKLREEYRKKIDELAIKRNTQFATAYGENFFYELMKDEDAIGWEWSLSSADTGCKICKKNEGKYRKGTGPKFPAHDGCTCLLSRVYK
jgi:hypothetical protein